MTLSTPTLSFSRETNGTFLWVLLIETISSVNPIFQTVFKTSYRKDKDKIMNAWTSLLKRKLEATNNLIKVIKRNAFGFRNFDNF